MCGLISGKYERPEEEAVLSMFSELESRGTDASGFASSCKGKLWAYKTPAPSSSVVHNLKEFKMGEAKAWVGHTRMATHGTHKVNSNNHPFLREGLALIHNGIISNYDKVIFAGNGKGLEGDCDSELILTTILRYRERLGVTGAIKQMAKELSGAMACALINRPGELWLWHREFSKKYSMTPLTVAVSTETPNFHFASTQKILETSLNSKLSWDVGSLDAGKGLHIKIVRGKLHITNFDVPNCTDTSYDYSGWDCDYDYDRWEPTYNRELGRFNHMYRRLWCAECRTVHANGQACANRIRFLSYPPKPDGILDINEDALYYCESGNCNTLLMSDEVITHANNTGHLTYRRELM